MKKERILAVAVIIMILAVAVIGFCNVDKAPILNLVLLAGLIAVTTVYTYSTTQIAEATKKQAGAGMKMAEEVKEQKYDAVRPIIDIEESLTDEDKREILSNVRKGKLPQQLTCTLRNIGPGPAIDVYSLTEGAKGESQRYDIGSMATNDKEREITRRLSLERNGGRGFLVAYYKDVYDRDIESRREVSIAQVSGGWEIGPLKTEVRKIAKEEHTK